MKARMMAVACERLFSGLVPTTEGYMYAAAVGMLIAMLHAGTLRQRLFPLWQHPPPLFRSGAHSCQRLHENLSAAPLGFCSASMRLCLPREQAGQRPAADGTHQAMNSREQHALLTIMLKLCSLKRVPPKRKQHPAPHPASDPVSELGISGQAAAAGAVDFASGTKTANVLLVYVRGRP